MEMYSKVSEIVNSIKYGKIVWSVKDPDNYVQFTDPSVAKDWGNLHYAEWSQKYMRLMEVTRHLFNIPNIHSPLEKYCGHDHRHINNYLSIYLKKIGAFLMSIFKECDLHEHIFRLVSLKG